MELTLWKALTGAADADSLFLSWRQTRPDFVDTAEPDWTRAAKLAPDVENQQVLPGFVPRPHKLSSAAHAPCRGPRTGLLSENETWVIIAAARRFSTSTPKELKRPFPFVFRHAVPFFSALSADAELGEKATVFQWEFERERDLFCLTSDKKKHR